MTTKSKEVKSWPGSSRLESFMWKNLHEGGWSKIMDSWIRYRYIEINLIGSAVRRERRRRICSR